MKKSLVFAAVAASLLAGTVQAQDLPKTQLKVVGGLSNLTAYNDYEKPFWTDHSRVVEGAGHGRYQGFQRNGPEGS